MAALHGLVSYHPRGFGRVEDLEGLRVRVVDDLVGDVAGLILRGQRGGNQRDRRRQHGERDVHGHPLGSARSCGAAETQGYGDGARRSSTQLALKRSEEDKSELKSLMRNSTAVCCLKQTKTKYS